MTKENSKIDEVFEWVQDGLTAQMRLLIANALEELLSAEIYSAARDEIAGSVADFAPTDFLRILKEAATHDPEGPVGQVLREGLTQKDKRALIMLLCA